MAKKKKRKTAPAIVPRMGPPTNLRPAGAHDDKRRPARAAERRAAFDDEESDGQAEAASRR
jgi:hypothetical protein